MNRRVISLLNDKGGVGRTAVGVCVAEALAARGRQLLFGDLDPQANATRRLCVPRAGALQAHETLAQCLDVESGPVEIGSAEKYIRGCGWDNEAASRIAVLPSHMALQARAGETGKTGAVRRLRRALGDLPKEVDYTMLDTPPGFGHLTQMCLEASDYAIIVASAEHDGADGALRTAEFLHLYGEDLGGVDLLGVIVNGVRERTRLHRTYLDGLAKSESIGAKILHPYLPLRVDIGVAMSNADPPSSIDSELWGTINFLADRVEEQINV